MMIWFDVEDLFEYAHARSRPSGIQRLSYELYAALQATLPQKIGFLRHDPIGDTMRVIPWSQVRALYQEMTRGVWSSASVTSNPVTPLRPLMHSGIAQLPGFGGLIRAGARRIPPEMRRDLGQAMRAQAAALRGFATIARTLPGAVMARHRMAASAPTELGDISAGQNLRELARPGDVLAVLGAPWSFPDYAGLISRMKTESGLRFAMLIYDLIPLVRPEFCDAGLVTLFSAFMHGCLPHVDTLMAISEATAGDVERWTARQGLALTERAHVLPIGTGFTLPDVEGRLPDDLSATDYVLFVSTIEARKNHLLVFRAWRRLLDEIPPERLPQLVFAGRVGWLVSDLMQQIRNSDNLGGKLTVIENPDDAMLAALYRGARFTLFPSLYEGWGLPVSESLAFGKVCLASSGTSIPEAGGPFCLYHDPDDVTDAVQLYRRAIEQPELIANLEARIAAEYSPVPWAAGAQALLGVMNQGPVQK